MAPFWCSTIIYPACEARPIGRPDDECPAHRKMRGALSMRAIECVCCGWRDYEMLSPPEGGYSRSVKEVIQPQVPLRLPCYDFAPVTALAFGRLAPCGFRHGLRALTASMA